MKHIIEISPIGYFKSEQVHPYEAGRQPDDLHSLGCIQLNKGLNFEQALIGLEGCPRIWIIFQFHHNRNWNPMVLPPRGINHKMGVFATRSPYRPNQIGMSCVKIKSIDIQNLKVFVEGADLLDGSPILDIKPYVAYADSFPECEPKWLHSAEKYEVCFSENVENQLLWLEEQGLSQLRGFLIHQLEFEPTNAKKKRIKKIPMDNLEEYFVIAYRTWRAEFSLSSKTIQVHKIMSGYSQDDLDKKEDPYSDKDLHRLFQKTF